MATYPAYDIDAESQNKGVGLRLADFDAAGNPRVRDLLPAGVPRRFQVVHRGLTLAQADALEAFYEANRVAAFDFDFLGTVYSCIFGDAFDGRGIDISPGQGDRWIGRADILTAG